MAAGRNACGFALLAVLVALALLALATQGVTWVLSQQAMREREAELLRRGQAYAQAIADFHAASPGSIKGFPREIAELLEDRRFLGVRRHLREPYADPIGTDWQFVLGPDGTIRGVHSASTRAPIRSAPIDLGHVQLPAAERYSDWKFVHGPPAGEGLK